MRLTHMCVLLALGTGLLWACLPAARCEQDGDCVGGRACINNSCQDTLPTGSSTSGGVVGSSSAGAGSTSVAGVSTSLAGGSTSRAGTSSSARASTSGPAGSSTSTGGNSSASNSSAGNSSSRASGSSSIMTMPSSGGSCIQDMDCGTAQGCITNARCNAGRCEYFILPPATACEDGDPCTHQESCNASGACVGTAGTCLPSGFYTPCTMDAECPGSGVFQCVGGRCIMALGRACVVDRECGSSHCVDGACCDEACDGICMACNTAGQCVGTAHDPACNPLSCSMYSSTCTTYSDVTTNLCAQKGACRVLDQATCDSVATVTPQPNTTPCRAAAGPCDRAENCFNGTCPNDGLQPMGHVCLAAQAGDLCDVDDTCDGTGVGCTPRFAQAGTPCRTHGSCNAAETCTGSSPTCPADVPPVYQLGLTCDGGIVGMFQSQAPYADGGTWETFKAGCNSYCDQQAGAGCCYVVDFPGINSPPVVVPPFWGCAAMAGAPVLQDGGVSYEGYACGY